MWEARRGFVHSGERVSVLAGGAAMAFADALEAMRRDESFAEFLLGELRAAPFAAFYWETPPITFATMDRPFEYVTIAAPGLERMGADPDPFKVELAAGPADQTVVAFPNLRGDALLIAPRCLGDRRPYGHLGAFLRGAPSAQQRDLLALTAARALEELRNRPLWISTCGAGVAWLHVRLDSRPKYYSHAPYRR